MMLQDMLDFCSGMLTAISTFLGSEPMIYLFGFIIMAITLRVFIAFVSRWKL